MAENIHPIFDKILNTQQKEELLKQKSLVIWMVGLSGSGKSTVARGLENKLHEEGYLTSLLDGDNLRTGLNNNLGFSEEDRTENIRRAAEASKLLAANGVITICSLISPTEKIRKMAADIIGDKYCEVFIDCPLEECEKRDVKGLYAKARRGEIKSFTGIDSPFEAPQNPHVRLATAEEPVEDSLSKLLEYILPKIKLSKN
ncbi:adenylyl-sulfate kinase [Fulvivirga ligni]|uniref:adenylyl-sulfate kinase n=1 Tax=Fulvivirga ligni TaxID=2904246 RepID=UPI001F1EFFB2|nr:adenylyl-sulfate kinase [Fulvivirga ligni]UII22670.1 adenylyl-sulfate kinase [Fulvivirga ligni]